MVPAATYFSCTVKAMISDTYGKMPLSNAKNQIIMEFEYFMDIFIESTTFNPDYIDEELITQFTAWLK